MASQRNSRSDSSTNSNGHVSHTSKERRILESIPLYDDKENIEYFMLSVKGDTATSRLTFWCSVVRSEDDDTHFYVGFPGHDSPDGGFDQLHPCVRLSWSYKDPSVLSLQWLGWDEECCIPEERPMAKGEFGTVLMGKAAIVFACETLGLEDEWFVDFMDASKFECALQTLPQDKDEPIVNMSLPEFYALTHEGNTWYQSKFGAVHGNDISIRATRYIEGLLNRNVDEESLNNLERTVRDVAKISGNMKWFNSFEIEVHLREMVSYAKSNANTMTWGVFFSSLNDAFNCSIFGMILQDMRSVFPDWFTLCNTRWFIRSDTVKTWNVEVSSTPLDVNVRYGGLGGKIKNRNEIRRERVSKSSMFRVRLRKS